MTQMGDVVLHLPFDQWLRKELKELTPFGSKGQAYLNPRTADGHFSTCGRRCGIRHRCVGVIKSMVQLALMVLKVLVTV